MTRYIMKSKQWLRIFRARNASMYTAKRSSLKKTFPVKTGEPWTLRFGVIAAFMLFAALSAPKAEASCGYYVDSVKPNAEMMAEHSMVGKNTTDRSYPCNGPQCRNGQSSQTIPLLAPSSPTFEAAPIPVDQVSAFDSTDHCAVEDFTFLSESHLLLLDPPPKK